MNIIHFIRSMAPWPFDLRGAALMLFLIALPGSVVIGQSGFNRTYDINGGGEIGLDVLENDLGYLVACESIDAIPARNLVLMQLDMNGDTLFQNIYSKSGFGITPLRQNSIVKAKNGGYLLAGDWTNLSDQSRFGWLVRLNQDLTIQWEDTFSYGQETSFLQLIELENGDIATTGFMVDSATNPQTDALLLRTDSLGNEKWHRLFGGPNYYIGWSVVECRDSGFALAASVGVTWLDDDCRLIKVDSNGLFQWDTVFGTDRSDGVPFVVEKNDGNILVATSYNDHTVGVTLNYRKAWTLEFEETGQLVREKLFGPARLGSVSSIRAHSSGGFILAGNFQYVNNAVPNDGIVGWMLRINEQGDSLWESRFEHSLSNPLIGPHYVRGLSETSDGGYIISGFITPGGDPQQIWVVKMDSNGCYDPDQQCWVGVNEPGEEALTLRLWPNPAVEEAWLEADRLPDDAILHVTDLQGRLCYTTQWPKGQRAIRIPLTGWTPGVYSVQVRSARAVIGQRKLVVGGVQ